MVNKKTITETTLSNETSLDKDIVINMEMINSFRRCYNKIQPFSLGDYFRDNYSDYNKYIALKNLMVNNIPITTETLNVEIEKIKLSNNKPLNTNISYTEKKPTEEPSTTVNEEKRSQEHLNIKSKLKWIKS